VYEDMAGVDVAEKAAYGDLVTNGTTMSAPTPERPGGVPHEQDEVPGGLELRPEDASADGLEMFPRDRYEAAMDGLISLEQYADELDMHVRRQLPRRFRGGRWALADGR
jgi:hypothetical protein